MNREMITKAEAFLKETFEDSEYLREHSTDKAYRMEHSYRVANIAKTIAVSEGFDEACAVIAGLLHDISYCEEMADREAWKNHGRRSAEIARPFLESLDLSANIINDICYGIAIHVDDEANFQWERTPFCDIVGDADNIDRFDVYRIYESLQYEKFSEKSLDDKREAVVATINKLTKYNEMNLATDTATNLWKQRIAYYLSFYEKMLAQLNASDTIV